MKKKQTTGKTTLLRLLAGALFAVTALSFHPPVHAATGDTVADHVLGQRRFGVAFPASVDGTLLDAADLAIDRSAEPNRVYVASPDLNRVLGWSDIGRFRTGGPADLVLGQPSVFNGASIPSLSRMPGPQRHHLLPADPGGRGFRGQPLRGRFLELSDLGIQPPFRHRPGGGPGVRTAESHRPAGAHPTDRRLVWTSPSIPTATSGRSIRRRRGASWNSTRRSPTTTNRTGRSRPLRWARARPDPRRRRAPRSGSRSARWEISTCRTMALEGSTGGWSSSGRSRLTSVPTSSSGRPRGGWWRPSGCSMPREVCSSSPAGTSGAIRRRSVRRRCRRPSRPRSPWPSPAGWPWIPREISTPRPTRV